MTTSRRLQCASTLAAVSIALTGCSSAMPSPAAPERSDSHHERESAAAWPLKFKAHYFGAHCFDTQNCVVLYRGFPHGASVEGPRPSVASYGRPLEKLLTAGRGPIPNFPAPAKVTWRSKDGTPLEAEIDIGKIFKDELIRHNVPRQDIPANTLASDLAPGIIVEVNDRTINVYMRAMISTKELQIPGNKYSAFRDDLIKVFSHTY